MVIKSRTYAALVSIERKIVTRTSKMADLLTGEYFIGVNHTMVKREVMSILV